MKLPFSITAIFSLFVATVFANPALAAYIRQEDTSSDGSGPFTNEVSGSGGSAQTYAHSSTTVTSMDGSTIVSHNSINITSNGNALHYEGVSMKLCFVPIVINFVYTLLSSC